MTTDSKLTERERIAVIGAVTLAAIICSIIAAIMWAWPQYNVYRESMIGKAKLAEAESSRQIATLEAKAKLESAKLLADAEIERAKGVAEANKIIGEGLKGHEEYLLYLWVQSLGDKDNHVIYIPTEANIPIMEASRFAGRKQAVPPQE